LPADYYDTDRMLPSAAFHTYAAPLVGELPAFQTLDGLPALSSKEKRS
jgi:hypothetical protein